MQHFHLHLENEAATARLGVALAQTLEPGLAIHLQGELGSGKTALTRALLRAAGHTGPVKSPTYALAEPYRIEIAGRTLEVMHFDLYRLNNPEEFIDAGFREYFHCDKVCIVEWPEKGHGVLPAPDIRIKLSLSGDGRQVECDALSELGERCLDYLKSV
jgi:tRNA threonylcarbamoyladenosine biosynthesis protein TsaE